MKKLFSLLLACLMVLSIVACAAPAAEPSEEPAPAAPAVSAEEPKAETAPAEEPAASSEPRTLRITALAWFEGKYDFQRIIKEFEEENPGVTVEFNKVDATDYTSNMLQWSQGKTNCDIYIGGSRAENLPYVGKDYLVEFDETNFFTDGMSRDDFFPAFLECGNIDGAQYVIPLCCEVMSLVVNVPMFKEAGLVDEAGKPIPPKTWEELYEYAEKLTIVEDGVTKQLGLGYDWGANGIAIAYLLQLNTLKGSIFQEDGVSPDFSSPESAQVMQMWHDLLANGYSSTDTFADQDASRTNFKSGKLAMHIAAASRWIEAGQLLGTSNVSALPVPGSEEHGSFCFIHGIIVPNVSENQDLAIKFIKEKLLQDDFLTYTMNKWGKMSPLKAHYNALVEDAWPFVVDSTLSAITYPLYKDYVTMDSNMQIELQRMLIDEQTIEKTQERLTEMASTIDTTSGLN